MLLTYRGSVNAWECDENNHLNVRFYLQRHWQTLLGGMSSLGFSVNELLPLLQNIHLRFLNESQIATPMSGYFGIVECDLNQLTVLTELRQSFTDEVLATCLHTLDWRDQAQVMADVADIPGHAAPRGVTEAELDASLIQKTFNPSELASYGFRQIGQGLVGADEVDDNCRLLVHHYMGRLSDAMPHLWGALHSEDGSMVEGQGGAVLEYRLNFYGALTLNEQFAIYSGVAGVSDKVQQFAHLVYSLDKHAIVLSAQAVGVRMDLKLRKAVVLDAKVKVRMEQMKINIPND